MILFARDVELNLSLEAEARLTLILVGVGLALLILITAAIFYLFPIWELLRQTCRFRGQVRNETEAATEVKSIRSLRNIEYDPILDLQEAFFSSLISTPREKIIMPPRVFDPHGQQREVSAETRRSPALFNPIRKYATVPHRPTAVYLGANRRHVVTPSILHPGFRPGMHSLAKPPASSPPEGFVTPHIAEWMKVADSVVGRHPSARPLRERVATHAEIDLISGHVHIPWVEPPSRKPRGPPTAVMVLGPPSTPASTVVASRIRAGPSKPGFLKALGNVRGGRHALGSHNAGSGSSAKRGAIRHARGKENVPPVVSSLGRRTKL